MKKIFFYLFSTIFLFACSSKDDDPVSLSDEEQQAIGDREEIIRQNKWTYSSMNRHYLWREEMPDSLSMDYTLEPRKFFKALLSSKDRFSTMSLNTDFREGTRVVNVAGTHIGELVDANPYIFNTSTVLLDSIYEMCDKRIGYLCYTSYGAVDDLLEPMWNFYKRGVDEFILDLRYNSGGYVSTCKYLCSCLVSDEGHGNVFQYRRSNDILAREMYEKTGFDCTIDYYSSAENDFMFSLGVFARPLHLKRIFILTSQRSASASEATIICLAPYMQVVTIGEQTVGKGVGSYSVSDRSYRYMMNPITSRYFNANWQTTPDEGLQPDYIIPGGYRTSYSNIGNTDEPLLRKALELIFIE